MKIVLFKQSVLLLLTLISSLAPLHCMRTSICTRLKSTAWTPLLWSTQQSIPELAQTLKLHNITVEQYINSQLKHKRAQLLDSFITSTNLTMQDLRMIAITLGMIQAYDAERSTPRFTRAVRSAQEVMRTRIPGIEDIFAACRYPYPIELFSDETNIADVYSQRIIKSFIHDIDDTLMIAQPDAGTFAMPKLFFSNSFWKASPTERAGAILREVGGHMRCEHGCELYLFEEVMKKRTTVDTEIHTAIYALEDLQAVEADLIPSALQETFAISISDWLKRENSRFALTNGEERIRNVESVIQLFEAVRRKQ